VCGELPSENELTLSAPDDRAHVTGGSSVPISGELGGWAAAAGHQDASSAWQLPGRPRPGAAAARGRQVWLPFSGTTIQVMGPYNMGLPAGTVGRKQGAAGRSG
jgi:hypothetical protein